MDFYELRCKAGLLNKDAQELFKVSRTTINNWNRSNAPYHVNQYLSLAAGTHNDWKGIEIRNGHIVVSETGYLITLEQLKLTQYRESLFHQILLNSQRVDDKVNAIKKLTSSANNDEFTINVYNYSTAQARPNLQ